MLCVARRVAAAALALIGVVSPAMADDFPFVPEQALVRLTSTASPSAFAASLGVTIAGSIPSRNLYLLQLPAQADEPAFVAALANDARVVWADLNFIAEDDNPGGSTQSFFLASTPGAFDNSTAPGIINLPEGQTVFTGNGIVVAVLDTGVDGAHPLLAPRITGPALNLVPGGSGVGDVGDGLDNDNDGEIDEFVGHGTFVSGIITRVAPSARILPIRVLDSDGHTTAFRLAQGMFHAIDAGAHVINLSLGTPADPFVLREALAEARSMGVTVVAAAGNSGSQVPQNPAALASFSVLGVAAVTDDRIKADFSNFGPTLAISAPGVQAVSTVPGGGFGVADGSSFATAWVSGAAAVMRGACPLLTTDGLRERLMAHAQPIDALNPNHAGSLGAGLLNVGAALNIFPGSGPPCDPDVNGDSKVTVDDLYVITTAPVDINGDGLADEGDADALKVWLRAPESRNMLLRP